MRNTKREFEALLKDCHVQASYEDVSKKVRRASDDALLALLRVLGVDITDPAQSGEILAARQLEHRSRGVEPVHVAWDGNPAKIEITLPSNCDSAAISIRLNVDGSHEEATYRVAELVDNTSQDDSSCGYVRKLLPLPAPLPSGHHELSAECAGEAFRSTIISAPRLAHSHKEVPSKLAWGCFLPLYALRTERDWGVGDFTSLRELATWVGRLGGTDLATLPLLAAVLDEPREISPYKPVSRLFWNELYIDIESIPELATFPECRKLIESPDVRLRIQAVRDADLVDYTEAMRLKRDALERLAARFFETRPPRYAQFQTFRESNPEVEHYARFRAATERQRRLWPEWPQRMQRGDLQSGDFDPAAVNYHMYVQWIAEEQLTQLRRSTEQGGCGLYLDLPVGVDPGGYDTWRYSEQFVRGARVGSPPDIVFTRGQDWGLPPLHPDRMRENAHDLFRRVIATNMKFARRLRIDHVLGLHRLYCIPPGFAADQGAYVRYPAEELYAVAILESHRNKCALVGENLGTVPPEVDEGITSHGIAGMWVAPYELEPGRRLALSPPPAEHVAMLNTHDMPPLASWWAGSDIDDRLKLGLVDFEGAKLERTQRLDATHKLHEWLRPVAIPVAGSEANANGAAPLRALLRSIATSPAYLITINLEDLWLETRPQNIPGEFEDQPNWRRKARYRLEQFSELPQVVETLKDVDEHRKTKEQPT